MDTNEKRGKAFVIVGPSGSGKSTLVQKVKQSIGTLRWSISYTTRKRRPGEVDGKDYFFVTQKEFLQKKERGDLIEWALVHGNFYGTSRPFIKSQIDTGRFLLLDIDIQGADSLKKTLPTQTVTIFIAPPSLEELEQRLRKRKTDEETTIITRLHNARKEMVKKNDYDHLIVNDNPIQSGQELCDIIMQYIPQ